MQTNHSRHPRRQAGYLSLGAALMMTLVACGGTTEDAADAADGNDDFSDLAAAAEDNDRRAELLPEYSHVPTGPSEDLIDAARNEGGKLTVYFGGATAQVETLFAAFQDEYDFVDDVQLVQVAAGDLTARIIQETQAGGATADYIETSNVELSNLAEREYLSTLDADEMGLPPEAMATDFAVMTTANPYGVMINTDLVPEDEIPTSWTDLLDETYSGSIALWTNPAALSNLSSAWGEERTHDFVEALARQNPVMAESTNAAAQAVQTGEAKISVNNAALALNAKDAGAPVDFVPLPPISTTLLYSAVPENAANPNTAKLYLAWATSLGSEIREQVTRRGLPTYEGSETAELFADLPVAGWRFDEGAEDARIREELAQLLPRG